ncbi:esterase-like activity of phytase family protein [Microvirga terrestris]|uniref:Esterase-like activity of phytase family protein n=1 Tax=Microvirga terrestris TaxID=2791024 RepID=A0ABS0HSF4_9HYPH|nr:esterase-like activity of phytase family protein [Microvirga terrestris]MBF9196130.1 esterase-like activity of phytase family protein [Microvirga terrestris]
MRLTRRNILIGGGAAAATLACTGVAVAQRPQALRVATAIQVETKPISRLSVTDPDRSRFGALAFRSGIDLRSDVSAFGGFSGLWRSGDGQEIIALADNAQILKARIETADGRLSGLSSPVLSPLTLGNGVPMRRSRYYDTESFALSGNAVFIGTERNHAVIRFERNAAGSIIRGVPIPVPKALQDLPSNGGLEAVAVAPQRSALSGALIGIAEGGNGFILTGSRQGTFQVALSGGYVITDLAFLPDGNAVILERRFSLLGGFACRLRCVETAAIRAGARIDGAVLYESEASHQVDNMEGLAIHREGGETVLSLISDNNFSSLQRTLLLEFSMAG